MSGDTTRQAGEEVSLEQIREASDQVEKSTAGIVAEKVRDRWQFAGAIVVLAITSVILYQVDGGASLDMQIFSLLSVGLLVYFLATLRSDVKME